jgi:hypothetical protein
MLKSIAACGLAVAVVAAIPATAQAPGTVKSRHIVDGAVRRVDLHNRSVTPAKLSGATRRLIASDDAFVNVTQSAPGGATGWAVSAEAVGDVGDWQVVAIVLCAVAGPVSQPSSMDSTSPKSVTAQCPSGDSGTGGGMTSIRTERLPV